MWAGASDEHCRDIDKESSNTSQEAQQMMYTTTQAARAEMAYRQERITRDFARAAAWRQRRTEAKEARAQRAVQAAEARVAEAAQAAHATVDVPAKAAIAKVGTAQPRHGRHALRHTHAA